MLDNLWEEAADSNDYPCHDFHQVRGTAYLFREIRWPLLGFLELKKSWTPLNRSCSMESIVDAALLTVVMVHATGKFSTVLGFPKPT